jgi:hypothetical protein
MGQNDLWDKLFKAEFARRLAAQRGDMSAWAGFDAEVKQLQAQVGPPIDPRLRRLAYWALTFGAGPEADADHWISEAKAMLADGYKQEFVKMAAGCPSAAAFDELRTDGMFLDAIANEVLYVGQ